MITNSGSQRFDIYAGTFTRNDQFTTSPFNDAFLYVPEIPFSVAKQVLPTLNAAGSNNRKRDLAVEEEMYKRGNVDKRYWEWIEEMDKRNAGIEKRAAGNLTLGYVTSDVGLFLVFHTPRVCS